MMINITASWRHRTLESRIKKEDVSQDLSRAAIFKREVKAGATVADWKQVRALLSSLEPIGEAAGFSNFQAKYDEETAEILCKIRSKMLDDLKDIGLKVLQNQYMLVLLQMNYLHTLEREKLVLQSDAITDESTVNLPEISKLLTEMMLIDKNCMELKEIREILIGWKNRNCSLKI